MNQRASTDPAGGLDVVCIGNAIVDIIAHTDDQFLSKHAMTKGAMRLIDESAAQSLYIMMGPAIELSGGSAANTAAGIGSFGGRAGYFGKVRNDEFGAVFRHDIEAAGVVYRTLAATEGPGTARCLILVTPDGQRTMNTYLGACTNLGPEDVDHDLIGTAKITYLEGYLYDLPRAKEAFRVAAEIAHAGERQVSLTLSDAFCVERHRAAFLDLAANHIDILFANEVEITTLFEINDLASAIERVRTTVGLGVITRSAEGSLIVAGQQVIEIQAADVDRVVDTTGAGDLYAAGFLFGLARGESLRRCGELGSQAAAEIISHDGARLQIELRTLLGKVPA